jgi:hypothetical protein
MELRGRVNDIPPFTVKEQPPMTRAEMEQHIETCERCQPVSAAFAEAINAGANIAGTPYVQEMINKAHADSDAAVRFYQQRRDAMRGTVMTTTKPARTKRAAVAATQEV